jgi:aspartate 1-decarboxylase
MFRTLLKSKIHRATVTQADVDYIGSITIDAELMRAAHLVPYEKVHVVDVNNGARLETYAIEGEPGSGTIGMNGAAARLIPAGDKVIIMSYAMLDDRELAEHKPTVVLVDERNRPVSITEAILAGMRFDDVILD